MCLSNAKSTQNLRNVDEEHHAQENEAAQKFDKIEKLFRHVYENETNRIN
jgi:hypothetical protein